MRAEEFGARMNTVLDRLADLHRRLQADSDPLIISASQLVEELSIAFEELQVADDEVRKKSDALAVSQEQYKELFEFCPDAYVVTDKAGIIRRVNQAATALVQVSAQDLVGKPLTLFIAPEQRRDVRQFLNHLEHQELRDRDVQIQPRGGPPRAASLSVRVQQGQKDEPPSLLWLIRDISARQYVQQQVDAAQQALAESEQLYRAIGELIPFGIWMADPTGRLTYLSSAFLELVGKSAGEIQGADWSAFVASDQASSVLSAWKHTVDSGGRWDHELLVPGKDGQTYTILSRGVPLYDARKSISGWGGGNLDVTALKRQRQELERLNVQLGEDISHRTEELVEANTRLRYLMQRIVSAQEDERRRVSRELHDESGQALTAIKMDLEAIRAEVPLEFEPLPSRLGQVVGLVAATMDNLRRLAQDLRPPSLDAAAVPELLAGLCRESERRLHLPIVYKADALPDLPGAVVTTLYRFLQEALTNISRHAQAHSVHVTCSRDAEGISLLVQDDGIGFEPDMVYTRGESPRGIGLVGMEERLRAVGGHLEIISNPGKGTRLIAHVPLEEAE